MFVFIENNYYCLERILRLKLHKSFWTECSQSVNEQLI